MNYRRILCYYIYIYIYFKQIFSVLLQTSVDDISGVNGRSSLAGPPSSEGSACGTAPVSAREGAVLLDGVGVSFQTGRYVIYHTRKSLSLFDYDQIENFKSH